MSDAGKKKPRSESALKKQFKDMSISIMNNNLKIDEVIEYFKQNLEIEEVLKAKEIEIS